MSLRNVFVKCVCGFRSSSSLRALNACLKCKLANVKLRTFIFGL